MESLESEDDLSCTPPEISDAAKFVTMNLLPEKSRRQYERQY